MLQKAKKALRLTTDAYDDEVQGLVDAALMDLGIAGVTEASPSDPLVVRAVLTYVKLHFGNLSGDEWDRLKRAYDEQKAQMRMATGYTRWQRGEG